MIAPAGVGASAARLTGPVVDVGLGRQQLDRRKRAQVRIRRQHATDQLGSLCRRHRRDLERINVHVDLDRVRHSTELQFENLQGAAPGVGVPGAEMRFERSQRGADELVKDSLPSLGSRRQLRSTTQPAASTAGFTQFGRAQTGRRCLLRNSQKSKKSRPV